MACTSGELMRQAELPPTTLSEAGRLRLKYREAIANAVAELGKPQGIGILFAGFQNFLQRQEGRKAGCPDVPAGCVTVLGKPQQDGKQFFTAGTQS